jgi:hypothetical protein
VCLRHSKLAPIGGQNRPPPNRLVPVVNRRTPRAAECTSSGQLPYPTSLHRTGGIKPRSHDIRRSADRRRHRRTARTGRTECKPRGLPRNVRHSGRPAGEGRGERLSGMPRRDCLGGADWPAPWIGRLRAGFADRAMVRHMAAGAGLTGQKIQRGVLKALALRIWPSRCNGAGHGAGGSSRARYFAGGKIGIPRHGCKTSRSRSPDTIVLA